MAIAPSPELLAVARRWFDAIHNDRANQLRNMMSESAYLRFVGTGEGELWSGSAVREGIAGFFGVLPDTLRREETFGEAFENGETGWACFTHELVFSHQPDTVFLARSTLVFALEDGTWKIVQRHGSLPTPNIEFVGTEQTAIADLVAAAKNDFSLKQTEGLASVMFTDIAGSTKLAAALGDRAWSAIVAAHLKQVRQIITEHGGQFVKSLGDGTMSSFASARQALLAACAIQQATARQTTDPPLDLRIGLNTGDVVQSEDDFFGSVVNLAARITASADPATIIVSDVTRAMAGTASGFTFSPLPPRSFAGFEGAHNIHRLEWQT